MATMKPHKLTQDIRYSVRTSPEIYEKFNNLMASLTATGAKFRRRKLTTEAAINAVLIALLDFPEQDQATLIRKHLPRFEANLKGVELDKTRPEDIETTETRPVSKSPRSTDRSKRGA